MIYNSFEIVGYRNPKARPNHYDDYIEISFVTRDGRLHRKQYQATTLPGTPMLLKPINPRGTAILVPGVYKDAYAVGLHKGRYPALVQVRPVAVWRDNDRDRLPEKTAFVDRGLFGINIHRASFGARLVGPDSAGCQVIKDPTAYEEFMELCISARATLNNRFTYTLLVRA